MGERYLIDTNTALYYLKAELPESSHNPLKEILNNDAIVSFITQIELLSYSSIPEEQKIAIDNFLRIVQVFKINDEVILKTIEIRKEWKTKLPDAIIAATAIVNSSALITRNEKDFSKISGLKIINPFNL